jgi:hypothetical protein
MRWLENIGLFVVRGLVLLAAGALSGALIYLLFAEGSGAAVEGLADLLLVPFTGEPALGAAEGARPLLVAGLLGALSTVVYGPLLKILSEVHPSFAGALRRMRLSLKGAQINVGGVALELTTAQVDALYPLYVELLTRVSNQSLLRPSGEHLGELKPAIDNLYKTFELARGLLSAAGPAEVSVGSAEGAPSAELLIVRALDGYIRPFLSRWHPHWDRWQGTGLPEARWPHREACRADLDKTLAACRVVIGELGVFFGAKAEAADVARGDALLATFTPADPAPGSPVGWGESVDAAYLGLWRKLMAGALELSDPSALAGLAELAKEALLALPPIPPDARLRVGERRPDEAMMAWLTLILELSQAQTQPVEDVRRALLDALGAMPGTDDKGAWSA